MTEPGARLHQFSAAVDAPRLDLLVAAELDLSRTRAATLIAQDCVTVNGRHERASYRPNPGDQIEIAVPEPTNREILGEQLPISIAYEDDDILVVDKAAGMVVHPAPGNWTGTLVNALKGRGALSSSVSEGREGIVHRLDKDTSGLLLVAKTDRAHRVLGAALQARRIVRRYAALAWGHLAEERITVDRPIARDPRDRKRMAIVSTGRPAQTDLVRLARFDSVELLRAHLHTGRTHQIRVHLASIGHPVVGDDTYGGGGTRRTTVVLSGRHFLHAAWLIFRHPVTGVEMDLRSPLPKALSQALLAAAVEQAPTADVDLLAYFGFYHIDP